MATWKIYKNSPSFEKRTWNALTLFGWQKVMVPACWGFSFWEEGCHLLVPTRTQYWAVANLMCHIPCVIFLDSIWILCICPLLCVLQFISSLPGNCFMFPPGPMQGIPLHFLSASYSPEMFLQMKNCLGCMNGQKERLGHMTQKCHSLSQIWPVFLASSLGFSTVKPSTIYFERKFLISLPNSSPFLLSFLFVCNFFILTVNYSFYLGVTWSLSQFSHQDYTRLFHTVCQRYNLSYPSMQLKFLSRV